MCFFYNRISFFDKKKDFPISLWEISAPEAKRDLIVKKIVITLIAVLNVAFLGSALYLIVSYCPFPTQAVLLSPFVAGALAALAYLKFPTFGVSSVNYTSYLNPTALAGRILAYIFFGPLMYAVDRVDWTPYHDPLRANKISDDLEKLPFEKMADLYGKHFNNLIKYGFIQSEYENDLMALYKEYKPIRLEIDFWQREGLSECLESKAAAARLKQLEKKWSALRDSFSCAFPHPKKPELDFTRSCTHWKLKARSLCCFGPPLGVIRQIQI